jgi:rubrerythrin
LSQALETHGRLLHKNEELKRKLAAQNAELEAQRKHQETIQQRCQELTKTVQDAVAQVEKLRQQKENEEKALTALRRKVAREKTRITEELAEYRRKVDVTEAEIVAAGKVKAEVARHGFSLELALGIASEFAAYTDARERLAEALEKCGKLTSYLTTLETNVKSLEDNQRDIESILSRLERERAQYEMLLSQLKAEISEKTDLVGFYHRYAHLQPLIEYLASSDYLTFHHCLWCGALFWVIRPGGMAASRYKCPWCGFALVEADRNAYAAVSQPLGTPLKLLL